MVEKNKFNLIKGILLIAILFVFLPLFSALQNNFEVKPYILKETIILGGESSSNLVVTNLQNKSQAFKVYPYNLAGFVSINESEFVLDGRESRNLIVSLKDTANEVEVYVGHIIVEAEQATQQVPVVIGIEKEKPSFTIIQEPIPTYNDVSPGGEIGMEIKIFNVNDSEQHSVRINYFLKNFNGEVLIPDQESRVVEDSVAITKIINLPENIDVGKYVFVTLLENHDKSIASYYFEIREGEKSRFLDKTEYLVGIVLIFILGMFGLLFYFFKSRDELFLRLQKQQSVEMKNNVKVIDNLEKEIENIGDKSIRSEKICQLKKDKKKIISDIKKKQKVQKKEIRILKKKKKKSEILKKLDEWKKQGYALPELRQEIKSISKSDINKKIEKWKKQGYNVGYFNKK